METPFRAGPIDHVELLVPDRFEAAAWYAEMLGLEIMKAFEFWAGPDGSGPLMLSSDGGQTKVALFEGEPLGRRSPIGYQRLAFGTDAKGFLRFLELLEKRPVRDRYGRRVTANDVVDHDRAWSVYFSDPYGNLLELTTYDYDQVSATLR